MSAVERFKTAVTSVSGPDQGWRGGLERSRAMGGWAAKERRPAEPRTGRLWVRSDELKE